MEKNILTNPSTKRLKLVKLLTRGFNPNEPFLEKKLHYVNPHMKNFWPLDQKVSLLILPTIIQSIPSIWLC